MARKIRILNKTIGDGEPCFIIAEAGVNHNGKFSLAKKMVDAAKNSGADAVKFQVFCAERVVTQTAEKAAYQKKSTGKGSQYDMLKKLELTEDEFKKLAAYAKKKNIIFLASAFDEKSIDFLDELKVPAFKIPSGEITNLPLLKHIAKKGKPIILSTGMSNLEEVEAALKIIMDEGVKDVVLLHCVSNYPAKVEEINLRAMATLKHTFGLPVGLSDHTVGTTVPIAAAALGATVIEKHFTLDRKLPGPDQKASLEPDELREMVLRIREVEKALGDGIKKPTKSEEAIKKSVRRSVVARVNIPKGTMIVEDMLDLKRPSTGFDPKYLKKVIGKRAKKDIKVDEPITFEKLMG
jgi:N-acetylneuraminate synthase/N,N'-diacetyllegionaminate synthase